jgi:hypothetical protein
MIIVALISKILNIFVNIFERPPPELDELKRQIL